MKKKEQPDYYAHDKRKKRILLTVLGVGVLMLAVHLVNYYITPLKCDFLVGEWRCDSPEIHITFEPLSNGPGNVGSGQMIRNGETIDILMCCTRHNDSTITVFDMTDATDTVEADCLFGGDGYWLGPYYVVDGLIFRKVH